MRDTRNTGNGFEPLREIAQRCGSGWRRVVLIQQEHVRDQQLVARESEIEPRQVVHREHEEQRGRHQDYGHGHLHSEQHFPRGRAFP
jgi:hypothetical protein